MIDIWKEITQEALSHSASLIAVSKTQPVEVIQQMYDLGQRRFGENRVQELIEKAALLPNDIEWHLIGHLQRNKVKDVLPIVHMIHAVDSLRLLKEIEKQGLRIDQRISIMLQFKIADEDSKYGFDADALREAATYALDCNSVQVVGLMGMATFTEDMEQVRQEFRRLSRQFDVLKHEVFEKQDQFQELSMGMSGDYAIALEEGSTMIRVGSLLFGARNL